MPPKFRFPPYVPPHGAPHYWQWETSGELPEAVTAYLRNRVDQAPISPADCDLVKKYLLHWINAPIWDLNPFQGQTLPQETKSDLDRLRDSAVRLTDADSIHKWIMAALEIGIDPL